MKQFLLFILVPFFGTAQIQIGQDINGVAPNDNCGNAISFSDNGSVVAIGSYLNDGNGINSGQVRVYKNTSGTWTQIGSDLYGSAAGDYSGISVSLSADGNMLAIGSPRNYSFSGQVRIYKNTGGAWIQEGASIQGATFGDNSGWSVSLSSDGNTVAIGAIGARTGGIETGGVKIYKDISGIWTQEGNGIDGLIDSTSFGRVVSLSADGNTVAISEPYTTLNGAAYCGRVRIYQNLSGTWTQRGSSINGTYANGSFGGSLSLSSDGNIVAIGAPGNAITSNSGLVKVYKNISGIWTQQGATINGTQAVECLGQSLALSDDGQVLVIGSHSNISINVNPGKAQVFRFESGNWLQKGTDIIGTSNENLGATVALSGDGHTLATGAIYNDTNGSASGQVRLFDTSTLLDVSHFESEGLGMYPNPVSDVLTIVLAGSTELHDNAIYNSLGQLIKKGNATQITVGDLPKGVYFVEVETSKGKATKSIIVK